MRLLETRALGRAALGVVLAACASHADAATSASAASKHVKATLVAETESIRPGAPFTIGLELDMEHGWHTYWRNPGDSGLATRIQWTLPEGVSAGPIEWPAPERIPAPPLMSYGYEGKVLLLSELRAPRELAPGSEAPIKAKVSWLECMEACIPGKAELEIALPVRNVEPQAVTSWRDAFAAARRELPAPSPWSVTASASPSSLVLKAEKGAAAPHDAYFFPEETELIEPAAAQQLATGPSGFRLELKRAANPIPERQVRGVLVADGRPYEVQAALDGVPAAAAAAPAPAAAAAALPRPVAPPPGANAASLPVALLFAFLGGLILNLMPCVLPVLSLKVMSFVKQGAASRGGALRHGLAFSLGVLVFFWLLAGALLALRAGGEQVGWGFQLQSPGFVVFLAALFLLLGLNMFGVFELGESLTALANAPELRQLLEPEGKARHGDLWSSFWGGALATITATPCTAPFMGSALGFTLGQSAPTTLLVFTFLGLGMATPYLVLSSSPRLLRLVPRPGRWMETFKQAMGFVLLGTVVFLLWLFGRQVGVNGMAGLLGALLIVGIGAWIYGRGASPLAPAPQRLRATVVAGALVAAGLALGFAQAQQRTERRAAEHDGWEPFSVERLDALRQTGTPVFVDFTADWCLTCQVNERVALDRAEVRERFAQAGIVKLRADWTLRDERITRALEGYGRQGVPLYVLYGRDPRQPPRLLPEVLSPGIVLNALDQTF